MMYRVLIADDEPHMLKFIEFTLRKGDFEILKANDGVQALKVAEAQKPNVIVLDVLMPGMDGVTALKNLKKNPVLKLIPVILLTARGHTLDPEEAKKAGASYYLTKPFSPTELLKQVQQLAASGSSQTVLN
ncbi:MAG: response regulator [Verrucomicrobia bacterium]|jgi:two-component system, OmpR family, alkaline phosphatase synthesis response regulator PhoP|nr:response regulator [Verrucomicrobiota bacterium]MBT4274580.1 response regulator [Verrucomicrobiota bacterium]MBT5063384.1 response regulator [Verrucomicrobiota bacterium]MBT5480126.1 response regulator [Verrucomicrobiota bacterium]MBT6237608.1 response regulator [Verrucomicrobiota bacterium]